jgi:RNA polymerase sigma-70 factor (ECF subfamily)
MVSIDSANGPDERPLHETLEGKTTDPEMLAISSERQFQLRIALASLPEKFREAVILRDIEELSYEEIAEAVGINVGTVKSRIARGRGELAKRLEDI